MTAPTLCFIDTETTGLDPDQHEVWEVACILRTRAGVTNQDGDTGEITQVDLGPLDMEYVWQLPVDLARADPMALNIGHFHERRHTQRGDYVVDMLNRDQRPPNPSGGPSSSSTSQRRHSLAAWAALFAKLTWGAHMIGMVPSFDTDRLWRLLRANGACPGWHYQPVDVETLAIGAALGTMNGTHLGDSLADKPFGRRVQELATLPWSSVELSRWFGVNPDSYERHSARGDARWARDLWDAIHEGTSQ